MQKIENATYYKCDYCGRISTKMSAMIIHERHCRKNPHNDCLCVRCGWAITGKAEGNVEEDGWDGPDEYKASALLSYCVKHKEFMSLRQSSRYADDLTNGNCFEARYADAGCDDYTDDNVFPYAYELGFSMSDLVKAESDGKNVDDVIRALIKQIPGATYRDIQSFIK